MRTTAIIAACVLLSAPAFAQTVVTPGPYPAAGADVANAAAWAHRDARAERHRAHVDRSIARYDAETGHYRAAAAAAADARHANRDANIDRNIARHDANVARRDESPRVEIFSPPG
jgi:hypothetical protein